MFLIRQTVQKLSHHFSSLDEKLNFPAPQNIISHYINGSKQEETDVRIDPIQAHTYIGKSSIEKDNFYDSTFLKGLLEYLFTHTPAGKAPVIELGYAVSEIINGQEDVQGYMNAAQQKAYILSLVQEHYQKGTEEIEIIDIEDKHPALFQVLRDEGIAGLTTTSEPILDPNNYNSLDIAKYLYRLCQNHTKFYERLVSTKTHQGKIDQKNDDNYYSLIEIACRLTDYLHGINIQLGEGRQKRYDAIINIIVHDDFTRHSKKKFNFLQTLQDFCQHCIQKHTGKENFESVYFNKAAYEEYVHKETQKKNILRKRKITSGITASLLSILIATRYSIDRYKAHTIQVNTQNAIKSLFEDKSIPIGFDGQPWYFEDDAEKQRAITNMATSLKESLELRYGHIDIPDEELILYIITTLHGSSYLTDMNKTISDKHTFIDDIFIPQNQLLLAKGGLSPKAAPYHFYQHLEPLFISTLSGDIPAEQGRYHDEKKLGTFQISNHLGETFEIFKITSYSHSLNATKGLTDPNSKTYIIAKSERYDNQPPTETTHKVICDYFYQSKPQIKQAVDDFKWRYLGSKARFHPAWKNQKLNDMLIKSIILDYDFINKEKVSQNNDTLSNSVQDINHFIDNHFGQKHKDTLQALQIPLQPYKDWELYKDAFTHTLNANKEIKDAIGVIGPIEVYDYNEKNIGIYVTQNGKKYIVSTIEYMKNCFIIAKEPGEQIYSLYDGQKIAEDFFAVTL